MTHERETEKLSEGSLIQSLKKSVQETGREIGQESVQESERKFGQKSEKNFFGKLFSRVPAALWGLLILAAVTAFVMGGVLTIAQKNLAQSGEKILRLPPDPRVSYGFQDLQGTWVRSTPQYWMYFKVNKNQYEWVIQFPETPSLRYFSRGDIVLANDVMVATQRGALGTPVDPERLYIGYMPISLTNINIRLKLSPIAMVWEIEPQESKRLKGPVSVLFNPQSTQVFNWTRAR